MRILCELITSSTDIRCKSIRPSRGAVWSPIGFKIRKTHSHSNDNSSSSTGHSPSSILIIFGCLNLSSKSYLSLLIVSSHSKYPNPSALPNSCPRFLPNLIGLCDCCVWTTWLNLGCWITLLGGHRVPGAAVLRRWSFEASIKCCRIESDAQLSRSRSHHRS